MDKQKDLLDELLDRVIEACDPEKIILFGSGARGDMDKNSDLDLLVVKKAAHRRKVAGDIYMNLVGFGHPVDVIVVRPEDIDRYRDLPYLVIKQALDEGKILYDKESQPQTTK
ncbi:nucleotidyltransferase domain-containing protein [Candidatus Bipolaricaulota bacterium]|nr:nucleotidyltransferase domain-containing protein [Candidatus Bipolaricaulota bacterium]